MFIKKKLLILVNNIFILSLYFITYIFLSFFYNILAYNNKNI